MECFERPGRHSSRLRLVPCVLLAGWFLSVAGCGGGTQADVQPPSPASPDFALNLSPATVAVAQGNTSSAISVSVTPLNGLSCQVQVSLGTLPTGVIANPASPFTVRSDCSSTRKHPTRYWLSRSHNRQHLGGYDCYFTRQRLRIRDKGHTWRQELLGSLSKT